MAADTQDTTAPAAPTEQVRLNARTVAKLRVIAAAHRESMGDILDEIAGADIDRAYKAVINAAASAELGGEG